MGKRTAHVATSRRASIVPRRVVGASETISTTAGHAKARMVVLGVVCAAISDLGSGFVAIFVVVEAHVCPCGESAVKLGLFGVEAGKRIKQAGNERGKRRQVRTGVDCTLAFTVPRDLESCHGHFNENNEYVQDTCT